MVRSLLPAALTTPLIAVALGAAAVPAATLGQVVVDAGGTVHADHVVIPPSDLLSPEAQKALIARLTAHQPELTGGIPAARQAMAAAMQPFVDRWLALYPSTIRPVAMNGVATKVIEPVAGIAPVNAHRVLISLHGGGFFGGAGPGALAEAIPVSGQGRIKVVSVDYRLAPENRFPAASEDVENVYRKLLESYSPENIGIYGCSAGGTLTGQAVAWLHAKGLPRPGAIGIFCSGIMSHFWYGGDSLAVTPMMNGQAMPSPEQFRSNPGTLYLAGHDQNDPLITPGLFPQVLSRFPPTLVLTGTRDNAMSNALITNMRLLQAGVETQLLVLEGVGHSEFNAMPGTPEATETFDLIWRFFDRHLGR